MNTHHRRSGCCGGIRLLFLVTCSALVSASASGAEPPPAPLSSTYTGAHVGGSSAAALVQVSSTAPGHEHWLGRQVDLLQVFTNRGSWKAFFGTLGTTRNTFDSATLSRRLHWSIPFFPMSRSWAIAASPRVGTRFDAEEAGVSGSAVVYDAPEGTYAWAAEDTQSAVQLGSTAGTVQFVLPGNHVAGLFRVSYRATTEGTMTIRKNGALAATLWYPATPTFDSAGQFDFQELAVPGVMAGPNDIIAISNSVGSVVSIDYIAFGNYDEWYRRAAVSLNNSRLGDPVIIVRPGWEFNGDWYRWQAAGNEENYKQVFRRIVNAFRSVSPRFRFDWNVNFGNAINATRADPELCYPGSEYVDVISMDLYDSEKNFGYNDQPGPRWDYYLTAVRGLNWLRAFALAQGKPVALSEWGVSGDTAPGHPDSGLPTDNPLFVQNIYTWLSDNRALYHHLWDTADDTYNGKLRDGDPLNTANAYLYAFGTPDLMPDGKLAPPANTSDDFSLNIPRAHWSVTRPVHANASLTAKPGRLRLTSDGSHFNTTPGTANVFLQRTPDKNFEIVTRLYGRPTGTNQAAGLVVYLDDDQNLRVARKRGSTNVFTFGGEYASAPAESSVADTFGDAVYLKVSRVGTIYYGYVSENGSTWTPIGTGRDVASLAGAQVGLACWGGAGFAADFDTFHVNKLEAEYGRGSGVEAVTGTMSGQKAVGWWENVGDKVEWRHSPGGANLAVTYAAASGGTKGLYINGSFVQNITFPSTGSSYSYQTLTVNQAVPAGGVVAIQHGTNDDPWNLDSLALSHVAKFEAEEAVLEGTTARDQVGGASNEGAIEIKGSAWGAVKFTELTPGANVTVRYRSASGGTIQVFVNGELKQTPALPAAPGFRDHPITLAVPLQAGDSLKLSKDNSVGFVVDYIMVR